MDISLRPQVEQYIRQAIAEDRYESVEEFLMEAAEALIAKEKEDTEATQKVRTESTPGKTVAFREVKTKLSLLTNTIKSKLFLLANRISTNILDGFRKTAFILSSILSSYIFYYGKPPNNSINENLCILIILALHCLYFALANHIISKPKSIIALEWAVDALYSLIPLLITGHIKENYLDASSILSRLIPSAIFLKNIIIYLSIAAILKTIFTREESSQNQSFSGQ